jgi:predicted MPP superfamily phosphohydrolase
MIAIISVIGVYALGNYYIGTRIFKGLANSFSINSVFYWSIFWLIAIAYIITMILGNYITGKIFDVFNLIGVYWLAILFYLIILFPVIDLIAFINRRYNFIHTSIGRYNVVSLVSLLVAIAIVFIVVYGTWNGRHSYVKSYDINIDKKINGLDELNVVMVSDIHLGNLIDGKRAKTMVQEINILKPDIILFAGDIVDTEVKPFLKGSMAEEFKNLKSTYGTYAALGNHDIMRGDDDIITEELSKYGVTVLRDDVKAISDKFYVVGRDDVSINRTNKKRKSLEDILTDVDKSKVILLIDHTPSALEDGVKNHIDLQVSGHTHKGQFFPNNLITSRIFEVDYGYLKKNDMNVVVSSGYGTWGPPIRLGSRSEIVNLRIKLNK